MSYINPTAKYTIIPNSILYSTQLSFKEKGLWTYLNSKPTGWDFSVIRMAEETSENKDTINRILNTIIEKGYLERKRLSSGKMQYTLMEKPLIEKASYRKSLRAKTDNVSKTDNSSNTYSNNNKNPPTPQGDGCEKQPELLPAANKKQSLKDQCKQIQLPSNVSIQIWNEWIDYRWLLKKPYKTLVGPMQAAKQVSEMAIKLKIPADAIVKYCMGKEWQSFYEPDKITIENSVDPHAAEKDHHTKMFLDSGIDLRDYQQ